MEKSTHVRLVGCSKSWSDWLTGELRSLDPNFSISESTSIDELLASEEDLQFSLILLQTDTNRDPHVQLEAAREVLPDAYLVLLLSDTQKAVAPDISVFVDDYLPNKDQVRFGFIVRKAVGYSRSATNILQGDVVLDRISRITQTGSWSFLLEQERVLWSEQLYEIFERDLALGPPAFDAVGTSYFGHAQDQHDEFVTTALREGVEYDLELPLITDKGSHKIIRAIGVPMMDTAGHIIGLQGIISDITQQRKMLSDLRENKMRLELAVRGAGLGVWDVNLATGETFTNPRWWEMLGFEEGERTYTLEFFESILHPDDKLLPAQEIKRIEEGGKNEIDLTLRLRGKNGKYRTIHDRARIAEFDADGKALRLVGTHMDLTEQLHVQRELQKTKKFMELAVAGGEIGLWELDLASNRAYFNEMWYDMLGYDRSEVDFSLEFFNSLLHPDDRGIPNRQMRKVFDGKDEVYEAVFRMRAKNGQYRHILAHGQFVAWDGSGRPTKIAGSHLDITAQIHAEVSYQETHRKLRALIDAAPIAIYMLDRDGAVTDLWNSAAEKIFGLSKDEVLGKQVPILTEDDHGEAFDYFDHVKRGGSLVQQRLRRKNDQGKELMLEITTGTFFENDGSFERVLVVASDVTELVRKEQHLEEALRDKHVLIQETHHRIKNNLAMVSAMIDMQRLQSGNSRYLDSATSRIQSIAMVHELLYRTGDFRHVDIAKYYKKLVDNILDSLTDTTHRPPYELSIDVDSIVTDQAIPLGLLLNELVTNSVKYAMIDGETLFVVTMRPAQDGQVTFSYKDCGPGFSMESLENSDSFGFQLIKSLLSQLRAKYELAVQRGFSLEFVFPIKREGEP